MAQALGPRPASRSGRPRHLERALAAAEAIQDDWAKSQALSQVAQALGPGRPAGAGGQAWSGRWRRPKPSRTIGPGRRRSARWRRRWERWPRPATSRLERALAAAQAIQDDWARSEALSQVAQALAQAGQPERAAEALEQALAGGTELMPNLEVRSQALDRVAQGLRQAGGRGSH